MVYVPLKYFKGIRFDVIYFPQCMFNRCFQMFLQHVLIVVKVIVAALIPDEPEWVRKKRAHMQYTSMQALRQQVSIIAVHSLCYFKTNDTDR